jgi:hypothetical protein
MGWYPGDIIEKAAAFLMDELVQRSPRRYSEYYDGQDKTHAHLIEVLGLEDDTCSAELGLDLAVFVLENEALVEKEEVDETLVDGEPDYTIALTAAGRQFHSAGRKVTCRGIEV